jgi:phospho-N-acetylmuramoyl-pentapeptide-transferase
MALVGAVDDLVKLRTPRAGLGWKGKLLGQFLVAAIPAACFYSGWCEPADEPLMVPSGAGTLFGTWLIVPWCMVVIVATTNAVNITDGLDGLATGCLALAVTAVGVVTYLCAAGPARELVVVAGAMLGALVGFLPLNRHPAQVFMGNVGSLALGGLLGYLALATGTEFWLPLVGGVFAAEVVSVILQIGSVNLLGKRVLLCAPLHHHFEFLGWAEAKVVRRFWVAAACCAVAGVGLSLAGSSFLRSSTATEGIIMARHETTSRR